MLNISWLQCGSLLYMYIAMGMCASAQTSSAAINVTSTVMLPEGSTKNFTCTSRRDLPIFFSILADQQVLGVIRTSNCSATATVAIDSGRYSYMCPSKTKMTWFIHSVGREYNNTVWTCQIDFGSSGKQTTNGIRMQVLIAPNVPKVIDAIEAAEGDKRVYVQMDQRTTLECVCRGGYPLPTVQWYGDTVDIAPLLADETFKEENGLFTVTTRYSFIPAVDDEGMMFVCLSSYDGFPEIKSQQSVQLQFLAPPKLQILHTYKAGNNTNPIPVVWGQAGMELILECESSDGHTTATINWFKNTLDSRPLLTQEALSGTNGHFTVLQRYVFIPTHEDDRATYVCLSEYHAFPEMASHQTVQLHLVKPPGPPKVTNSTHSVGEERLIEGQDGHVLTLECVSSSYPQPEVHWYRDTVDDSDPLAGEETVLTVGNDVVTVWKQYKFTPSHADHGANYICQTSYASPILMNSLQIQTSVELRLQTDDKTIMDAMHGANSALRVDHAAKRLLFLIFQVLCAVMLVRIS